MSVPAQSILCIPLRQTSYNPDRSSQFSSTDLWVKAGLSKAAADNYLGAIKASLENKNMILDMRIPQTVQYEQNVLDVALAQYLAGELDAAATEQQIATGWNDITNKAGKDQQLAAYVASLGVQR